jgi:signal transduction histidine kinase
VRKSGRCENRHVAGWASTLPQRPWRFIVSAAVVAYAVAAIVVPGSGPSAPNPTTYGDASAVARAADLAAGLGLLAAGLFAAAEPRRRRLGVLTILAGIAWFGPDWEGWNHGVAFAVSLGAVAPPLFLAFVVHIVLSLPTGRLHSRLARAAAMAAYALAAVVAVGQALFRNPILDPYCWRNCIHNSFLVRSDFGLTRTIDELWPRALAAIGVAVVLVAAVRLATASGPARRQLWRGLGAAALVGAAASAYAATLWRRPLEDPRNSLYSSLFLALSLSVVALAAGIGWSAGEPRRTRASVARLARELREAPRSGGLQDALAAALGDPTLEVLYWLPESQRFVDAAGKHAQRPAPGNGRAVTPITRDGEPVATVVHDATLLDLPDLGHEIGSAAHLAVENERLQAEVLAQLEAVQASRARIVERADEERRRLERNLHDGAQQRLLALSYQLRLAKVDAEAHGDGELAALLAASDAESQAAIDELRQLAQGIYPAVLTEAGLEPALTSLADTAPLPVELSGVSSKRYPAAVEAAVYLVVAKAIDDATARNATFVSADVRERDDWLVVVARDDGERRGASPTQLSDRVGALGGSVDADTATLRVEIPCA